MSAAALSPTHCAPAPSRSWRQRGSYLWFGLSSLACAGVDNLLVWGLNLATGLVFVPVAGARLASASLNFSVNRWLLSSGPTRRGVWSAAWRYGALAAGLMLASYVCIKALVLLGLAVWVAKICADVALSAVSYGVQKCYVYRSAESPQLLDGVEK